MNNGLKQRDIETINNIFKKYKEIKTVYLFGSRATGNYKTGSDIDFAVMNKVDDEIIYKLIDDFEESSLPYFVDVINYCTIDNEYLKANIDKYGILFYSD